MISALVLMMACDSPVALPPKMHTPTRIDSRMVQMDDLRGYLQRPMEDAETTGILLVVDQLNQNSRNKAKAYTHNTVIVIDSAEAIPKAKTYLKGVNGVQTIQVICLREDCGDINPTP